MFGSLNWLSIGFFQYDIVAGFFGYQGSLFSRIVYIVVGISACWLLFSVIKNKGRLNPQKLKHDEMPLYDKHAKMEKAVRDYDKKEQPSANENNIQPNQTQLATGRNHDNFSV